MVLFPKDDELTIGDTVPAYIDKHKRGSATAPFKRGKNGNKINTNDGAIFRN